MANTYKYRLIVAPAPERDGSTCVVHKLSAVYQLDGGDEWFEIANRLRIAYVPAAELTTVMDMPHGTGAQKAAKNTAYKNCLTDNFDTVPVPVEGWEESDLDDLVTANLLAVTEADRAHAYLTETLGQSYPVDFSIT